MPVNNERILDEIRKGNIVVEKGDEYCISYPIGLPHCPCFADDGVTDCLGRYDAQAWFR